MADKETEKKGSVTTSAALSQQRDLPVLGEDRKRELRKQAAEAARKKVEEEAEEKFLAEETEKAMEAERKKNDAGSKLDFVEYRLNLAPSCKQIRLNGTVYMHGVKYKLRRDVYDCIRDIESRGWVQEELRLGADDNPYKIRGRTRLSARNTNAGASH